MHYVARIKKRGGGNWVYITIWALVHIIPLQTLLWISKEYWKCCTLSCSQSSLSLWSDACHHFAGKTLTGYSHLCLRLPGLGEVATPSFLTTREHWLQVWQGKKHSEPLFPTFSPGELLVIFGGITSSITDGKHKQIFSKLDEAIFYFTL